VSKTEYVIRIDNVKKYFRITKGTFVKKEIDIKAVDGVSLSIKRGETLGIVGESGSGKTTLARLILSLTAPTSGDVYINDIDVLNSDERAIKEIRRKVTVVFQDPSSSLNPRRKLLYSLTRPLIVYGMNKKDALIKVEEVLKKVQLDKEYLDYYPHQLSGGQLQRACIARALALDPEIIILDEPTSALDISIQAQILNLLISLQNEYNLTYIFITHDLNVVRYMSDEIMVMYLGKVVETADTDEIFSDPRHPYTFGLLNSINTQDSKKEQTKLKGEPDSMINIPLGCRLSTRCPYADEHCRVSYPPYESIKNNHKVACFKHEEIKENIFGGLVVNE